MSLEAPLAEEQEQPPSVISGADSSLTNPITTPSCSNFGGSSYKSSSVSSQEDAARQPSALPSHAPSLITRSVSGSVSSAGSLNPPIQCGLSPRLAPSSSGSTPKPRVGTPRRSGSLGRPISSTTTPDLQSLSSGAEAQLPRLRVSTPGSRTPSSLRSNVGTPADGATSSTSAAYLNRAVSQILCGGASPQGCHGRPQQQQQRRRHVGHHYRDAHLQLATWRPQQQQQPVIEPYARRKADPQGYLFTCFLDYHRFVRPPPPACFDYYVRPESLQYSAYSCSSACDTPRSSTSSFSQGPLFGRLYSRPPTPAPLVRAKEVHRIAMAGAPVDVKELSNCYLFVAEVPGLKNTDVKVQVENDSILKISGERKREECEECEVKYIRVERQAGKFQRKFNLPANANLDCITAACQDGLLSVVVPKNPPLEHRRPKNFDVKIATLNSN